jgi:hypothetical protein
LRRRHAIGAGANQGGRHLLIRSFHVSDRFFAKNWSEAERQAFLDWAQGQGYNTLSIASHYLNRNLEGRGKGWETPALWPLNAAEYQRMERALVLPVSETLPRLPNRT